MLAPQRISKIHARGCSRAASIPDFHACMKQGADAHIVMATFPSPGVHQPPKPTNPSLLQESPLPGLTQAARAVIRHHNKQNNVYQTRLQKSSLPARPHLKLENEQITNSFKVRGAINKLHNAYGDVVTASTGNHALAVAHASKVYNRACKIFVPRNTARGKMDRLRGEGCDVVMFGDDCLAAEIRAREYGKERGMVYVSPYNDLHVIAGQGSIAYEILEELGERSRSIYVTVGGGGLITGMATVLKPLGWRIVGCQPQMSAVMLAGVKSGRVVDCGIGETVSDGSAGAIESDSITLEYCAQLVDSWVVVTEEEITAAVAMMKKEGLQIEGAAGVAVAGYLGDGLVEESVIILCGGNV